MKNDLKQALSRELNSVRVSEDLKRRTIRHAVSGRQHRRSVNLAPLAMVAALMIMFGLAAGLTLLRSENPDLASQSQPLAVGEGGDWVYVGEDEALYHWRDDCAGITNARRVKALEARDEHRRACSACAFEGDEAVEKLVWITDAGLYYHDTWDCSGLTGATGLVELEARMLGKKACPICLQDVSEAEITTPEPTEASNVVTLPKVNWTPATPEPTVAPTLLPEPKAVAEEEVAPTVAPTLDPDEFSTPMPTVAPTLAPMAEVVTEEDVWMTKGGRYYHCDQTCSGMVGAQACPRREAEVQGHIACPVCMEQENVATMTVVQGDEATVVVLEDYVWTTKGGRYYHCDQTCSGMVGAQACLRREAEAQGHVACPMCMAQENTAASAVRESAGSNVWLGERYYHAASECLGQTYVWACSENEAIAEGLTACPSCMQGAVAEVVPEDDEEPEVWATKGGRYYHGEPNCSGMQGAEACAESEAILAGKEACPTCMPGASAEVVPEDDEEPGVWATKGGRYYHGEPNCSGMQGAETCAESEAILAGKEACPQCLEGGYVWMTEGGVYCHRTQHCSGMRGAHRCTLAEAQAKDKQVCPVCAGELPVWMAKLSQHYHLHRYCEDMVAARNVSENEAVESGKTACPNCLSEHCGQGQQAHHREQKGQHKNH